MRNLYLLILFLGLSFETLQVHALNKEQFGQKSERCYRQRKWDGSFDGFCGCYPWGRAFTMGKETLSGCFEKKDEYHKEEALREIMAYYVTLKNYSELYQPNNGRRTHRCLLLLKSGEECSFGFDSRNRKYICRRCSLCRYQWWYDLARMQNDCWMHECSFMERWRI